jgi:hypothetical protein
LKLIIKIIIIVSTRKGNTTAARNTANTATKILRNKEGNFKVLVLMSYNHFAVLKNLAGYKILSSFSPVNFVGPEKEFVRLSY